MARITEYQDISRRGLIKLCEDFDEANDNALYNYLQNTDNDYEKIRCIERLTVKVDDLTKKFHDAGKHVGRAAEATANKILDKVIDSAIGIATKA